MPTIETPTKRTIGRIAALAAAALAVTSAQAAAAGVSTVAAGTGAQQGTIVVRGDAAANNVLLSAGPSTVAVRERSGGRLVPGAGCSAIDAANVSCTMPAARRVIVRLGDGNDSGEVGPSARDQVVSELWGDAGYDILKAQASSAPRRTFLIGGAGPDWVGGSPSSEEALWGGTGGDHIMDMGGADHIDGGDGQFASDGTPVFRTYADNPAECQARGTTTYDRPDSPGGYARDLLDLGNMSSGVLADINICRLGYFDTSALSLVHGIEDIIATRYNDRVVGNDKSNQIDAYWGHDWVDGQGGYDLVNLQDGGPDTIADCNWGSEAYSVDPQDEDLCYW